jgi:hypothetical protein
MTYLMILEALPRLPPLSISRLVNRLGRGSSAARKERGITDGTSGALQHARERAGDLARLHRLLEDLGDPCAERALRQRGARSRSMTMASSTRYGSGSCAIVLR